MVITKLEDVTRQGSCKILWRKLRLRGSLLLVLIQFQFKFQSHFHSSGWGGGGRLFEAGCLLTFSAFRMGAYSRWALIRGWALIRINTVHPTSERSVLALEIESFRWVTYSPIFESNLASLRWLDWIFWGWYLPSVSINYVGMSKDMEKRLPQLHYIKMKISYDLGFIAIGVAMAT